jgi:hypothetical protein
VPLQANSLVLMFTKFKLKIFTKVVVRSLTRIAENDELCHSKARLKKHMIN